MATLLREARATLVPDPAGRDGPLPPLMLVLTVVTGLVDAVSYLELGRVFVANMTGNVVFTGFALAGAPGFSLAASLVALAAFVVGAFTGGAIVHRTRAAEHRGRLLLYALLTETVCVAAALVVILVSGSPYTGGVRFTLVVLLGLGLGVQNAAARAISVPDLKTTVLTLTITGIAADSRAAGGAGSRAGRRALSVAAMLLGALGGALAVLNGHPRLPLLLAVVLLVAVTLTAVPMARGGRAWATGHAGG
ncbi:YoaK family protein [Streptomyces sp. AM 2-1-1]|uniref:YoaK family protein n=1 Tax=unclassified Streptomyces TaxID=2593676 RepID=UPI0023B9FCA1|nr:YoaK family protein [Streptomyces sp. AM 2-1-1]WEH38666.1 YoaK family protein [Streptomyces sp. AM 2-1-1]